MRLARSAVTAAKGRRHSASECERARQRLSFPGSHRCSSFNGLAAERAPGGYGRSAPLRQALSARDLRWAVGIPRHQKVYPPMSPAVLP